MNSSADMHRVLGLLFVVAPAGIAPAADMTLTLSDFSTPGLVSFKPNKPLDAKAAYILKGDYPGIPAQVDQDGRLCWYQPRPCIGNGCTYQLATTNLAGGGIKVEQVREGLINVTLDDKPFTVFNYGKDLPKPFLFPVIGPTGAEVTRSYPMKDIREERGGGGKKSRQDHPHHRSIWTAHGDVRVGNYQTRGTDYWAQDEAGKPPGKGLQKVSRIVAIESGSVFGRIIADVDWVTPAGKKELADTRTYTFYKTAGNERVIDFRLVLKFTESDVMFADTKEGGLLSLRVAVSMDELTGGKMINSKGRTGMKECWGEEADWCDYVGPVDGQTVGIAVFDAGTNFPHPTRWHIRDYGLYTANPFMAGAVTGELKKKDPKVSLLNGSQTWKKGETAEFNYRILIHDGDTAAAKVAEQYHVYTEPAKVAVK